MPALHVPWLMPLLLQAAAEERSAEAGWKPVKAGGPTHFGERGRSGPKPLSEMLALRGLFASCIKLLDRGSAAMWACPTTSSWGAPAAAAPIAA